MATDQLQSRCQECPGPYFRPEREPLEAAADTMQSHNSPVLSDEQGSSPNADKSTPPKPSLAGRLSGVSQSGWCRPRKRDELNSEGNSFRNARSKETRKEPDEWLSPHDRKWLSFIDRSHFSSRPLFLPRHAASWASLVAAENQEKRAASPLISVPFDFHPFDFLVTFRHLVLRPITYPLPSI
jgi:hypothetical protein